ncbi:MAG: alr [Microbacteriaceae bacterium]|nr:alr [Microbacteriaceae bacterium]
MTARAIIDLDAFRHNVRVLAAIAAPSATMLAVKANAYGHGMLELAPIALESGASSLAVLDIPAALALREAGVTAPLFAWLHGLKSDFGAAARAGVELGVSSVHELEAIEAARPGHPVRVHLKIDTGLHRNGASPEEWPALVTAALAAEKRGAVTVFGAWSHLADASEEEDAAALAALHEAIAVAEALGARFSMVHLAASSAGIRMPEARLDLVRFGIAAYGISPFDDITGRELGLIAVMTLVTTVTSVEAGAATIGVGFGDGLAGGALPRAEAWAGGARARILSIGVDESVIEAHNLSVGDEVVLFGTGDAGEPTAEEWANWADSIGDEIVVRIAQRVERVYTD